MPRKIERKNTEQKDIAPQETELAPIDVREWAIEPDAEEFARITVWDSLIIG